jgi:tRNA (guanine-N7-)-methyltransferase
MLYGRRRGRVLKAEGKSLLEDVLPQLKIQCFEGQKINPQDLFPHSPSQVCLEVGFGYGEHLAMQAELYPQKGFLGCEPFVNGVASLLQKIDKLKCQNIRIFTDDAHILLNHLKPHSLDQVFILFPDPWPKKRHFKRRFVSIETLKKLTTLLKPMGEVLLATDHQDYFEWMKEVVQNSLQFENLTPTENEWKISPQDWILTRYQDKALKEGRVANFLRIRLKTVSI